MAGTPDRSGEHKASGGPAPEDPRLAVSREPSGVDQETAVFSVRDAAGEAPDPDASDSGDERLRAAVAAWVAGDDGSADASAIANPAGEVEAGSADADGDARSDGAPAATADADAGARGDTHGDEKPAAKDEAEPTADGEPSAKDDAKADAQTTAGGDAHGDAKPVAEADAKPDTEIGPQDDAQPTGKPGAEGGGKPTADAESDTETGPEDDVQADGESGSQDDDKPVAKADTQDDRKQAAEAGNKSDDTPATKPEPTADAKPTGSADATADAKSDDTADAKGDELADSADAADAKPDAKADAEPADSADGKGGGTADAKAAGSVAGKSEVEPAGKDGAKAAAKSAATADAEPDAKADGTSGAKPDGKGGGTADAEPADSADGKSDAEPEAKADGKAGAKPDGKAGAKSAATADAKPEAKADGKADAKPDAKADAKPDAKADAKGDVEPDAKSDREGGGASGGVGSRGADQETAVFKAVSQPVDQPTTTLKAAGTAKSSKFVPLKGLDEGKGAGKELPPEAEQPTVEPAERTTQQPLPPKPPLDLLAELTNTPPPAETRVRTAVRRVKVWTPLVILLVIVFGVIQAVRPLPTPSLSLTTDATYSFDGDKASLPWPGEGQGWMDVQGIGTMDNFGKQTPVPVGSVAKSMTAYLVLKDHPLKAGDDGPGITVDATAEKEGGYDADGQNESTLNTVKEGDKISQKDALAAVMIPSANNIARLLARWDAGSEEAFVKKMNATAKKLGMKNTTYTDPSGLKESTVSTAEDQVKLGNELVQIPALTDITKLPTWTDPSGKKWTNYNRLVPYDGAIGIKTGTTTKAGGNLLFAATKDAGGSTVTVVGAVLGQHKAPIIDTVNAVSKTAMLAAQDAVTSSTVLKKGDVVGYVDDQLGGRTPVTVTKDVKAVGWAGKTVHLQLSDQDGKSVPHTGKAGDTVGVLEVGDGEGGAVEVPVALQKGLTEPGFGAKLTRVG
ncbi:D-alanyl-D-alanine carboxypeptidase [Streptomyces sp. NPDC102360]|uniref:D-alanyl-D-alanine carboxypeptidase n=1 Tax=Streptomyces sp. NPDC102360 TaxID=3366160 RepID=UPI0038051F86